MVRVQQRQLLSNGSTLDHVDTSRVSLALARSRIKGARYQFYLLADSKEGQEKEGQITRSVPSTHSTYKSIKQGFVYARVPHVTLKSIANNSEIDLIWERFQAILEPLRMQLNKALDKSWEEWEIPSQAASDWSPDAAAIHKQWLEQLVSRQDEMNASISAKADFQYLYDRPHEAKNVVRVAGPFTLRVSLHIECLVSMRTTN